MDEPTERPATRPGRNGGTLNNGPGPGKPKGSVSITRRLKEALAANDEKEARALADALIKQAKRGNPQAIRQVLDRIDGPIAQRIELDDVSGLTEDELHARTAAAFGRVRAAGADPAVRDPGAEE